MIGYYICIDIVSRELKILYQKSVDTIYAHYCALVKKLMNRY